MLRRRKRDEENGSIAENAAFASSGMLGGEKEWEAACGMKRVENLRLNKLYFIKL